MSDISGALEGTIIGAVPPPVSPVPPAPEPAEKSKPKEPAPSASCRLLEGYSSEEDVAAALAVSARKLRADRQRCTGPPWVKVGRDVYYPIDGFREWLKFIERRPVRARRA